MTVSLDNRVITFDNDDEAGTFLDILIYVSEMLENTDMIDSEEEEDYINSMLSLANQLIAIIRYVE